jgi:hypothetical protein
MLGVAIVERDQAAVIHRHDAAAQVDVDALGPVVAEQMLGDQRRRAAPHQALCGLHHRGMGAQLLRCGGQLQSDRSTADDQQAGAGSQVLANPARVIQGA